MMSEDIIVKSLLNYGERQVYKLISLLLKIDSLEWISLVKKAISPFSATVDLTNAFCLDNQTSKSFETLKN